MYVLFCSYLLPDKGRSSKQKTPVLRKCCSPAWNHTFAYQGVTLDELSARSLELTLWDHDRLASNEFLGGVRLNLGTGSLTFLQLEVKVNSVVQLQALTETHPERVVETYVKKSRLKYDFLGGMEYAQEKGGLGPLPWKIWKTDNAENVFKADLIREILYFFNEIFGEIYFDLVLSHTLQLYIWYFVLITII